MNIFAVDRDPRRAARALCDRHVVKMTLETAQLLCGAFPAGEAPYRRTHHEHPCARWTRASRANYRWLCAHGRALAEEYQRRYGREHKSGAVIEWCALHARGLRFPGSGLAPFPQALPEPLRGPDAVAAYRRYYVVEKARFATWKPPAREPRWFTAASATPPESAEPRRRR